LKISIRFLAKVALPAICAFIGPLGLVYAQETGEPTTAAQERPRAITCADGVCKYTDGGSLETVTTQSQRGAQNLTVAADAFAMAYNPTSTLAIYRDGTMIGRLQGSLAGPVDYGDEVILYVDFPTKNTEIYIYRATGDTESVLYYNQNFLQPAGLQSPRQIPGSENP
jgi:hypothetical protein